MKNLKWLALTALLLALIVALKLYLKSKGFDFSDGGILVINWLSDKFTK